MQMGINFSFIIVAKNDKIFRNIFNIRNIRLIKTNLKYPIKRKKTIYEQIESYNCSETGIFRIIKNVKFPNVIYKFHFN